MRSLIPLPLIVFAASISLSTQAQDTTAEEAESGARKILSDPRLQDLMRSAKDDPEAMAENLQDDPESAVRRATRIFQDNQENIDTSAIDTPENRAKAKALSTSALSRANELAKQKANEISEPREKVAATRATPTTSEVATPVAMPVEGGDNPIAEVTGPDPIIQNTDVAPLSNTGPTEAHIPESPHLTNASIPEPTPLKPKYELGKQPSVEAPSAFGPGTVDPGADYMEINARESIMDSKKGLITFLGDVYVDHPDYDLKCEKLEIQLTEAVGGASNGGSSSPAMKRAIATGGMVEIKRVGEEGVIQVALARKADYDALTQDFVLSGGPPYIQDGQRIIETNSQDARIIMRGDGTYEVSGSDAGSRARPTIRIPVEKSKGKEMGLDTGIGIDLR